MLAERFNGSTGIKETTDRSQRKACWKNLKAKKDAAEERRGMFKTAGGPPPMITDPLSKKIIDMIPQQISPLPNCQTRFKLGLKLLVQQI